MGPSARARSEPSDLAGEAALSPGLALLRACVRRDAPGRLSELLSVAQEAGEGVSDVPDRHGLAPLVYARLEQAGLRHKVPADTWDRLAQLRELVATRQAFLLATGSEVVGALRKTGLRWVLPVKGLALAALWWPEHLLRAMDDVDLLVPKDQLPHAERVLEEAGFARARVPQAAWAHHHGPAYCRGVALVELHWALWAPSALPIPHPDPEAIAQRAVTATLGDHPLTVPSPEDAFILSAGALARGRFDVPFRAWADLCWLLTDPRAGVRPDALLDLAHRLGVSRFTDPMVRLTDWLFGAQCPDLSQPTGDVLQAEARLRPIVVRRLTEGTHRSDRHAWLLQVTRSTQKREQVRGSRVGRGALGKAARYAAGLVLSGRQRKELREELVISRSLEDLQRSEPKSEEQG